MQLAMNLPINSSVTCGLYVINYLLKSVLFTVILVLKDQVKKHLLDKYIIAVFLGTQ